MGSPFVINAKNLSSLGYVLNILFRKNYPLLMDDDTYNARDEKKVIEDVKSAIIDVYSQIGIEIDIKTSNERNGIPLQEGDILRRNQHYYLVIKKFNDEDNNIVTIPELTPKEAKNWRSFSVIRPDLSLLNEDDLVKLQGEIITDEDLGIKDREEESFQASAHLPDDALQIGDLTFIVGPTQISFTTENGYQFFPTIRTQGTPKIPTMQHIKHVSINLIFANEQGINYELIHLLAMFKRTPIVNVRNKDIVSFFKDLTINNKPYIPMALETLQIQTIEGFPNSLQASITVLPIDPRAFDGGLKALLSMSDVKKQQVLSLRNEEYSNQIRQSESKLRSKDFNVIPFSELVGFKINTSYNFSKSLPFRAFYQSIIRNRKNVKDNRGHDVLTDQGHNFDITIFSPENKSNMLSDYNSNSNQKPITLSYKFIAEDFRDYSKKVSEARRDQQFKTINRIKKMSEHLEGLGQFIDETFLIFHNREELFEIESFKLTRISNVLQTYLAQRGIDSPGVYQNFNTIWGYFLKGMFWKSNAGDLAQVSRLIFSAIQDDKVNPDNIELIGDDYLGVASNNLVWVDENGQSKTIVRAFKDLWNWAEESDENKNNLIVIMNGVADWLIGELTEDEIIIDSENPEDPYKIVRIPIQTRSFQLNDSQDIVVSWNAVYSNKFIPMQLSGHKYPFYQHIGSDDIALSMKIMSDGNTNSTLPDLKSEFSRLSDDIHNTVKIVMYSAPDLMNFIDPRITIDVPPGHIFDALGIRKVVFNSSNTTNVQGNPKAWQTTVDLTQSNFTLQQYHKIESDSDSTWLKALLAPMIARLRWDRESDRIYLVKYIGNKNREQFNNSSTPIDTQSITSTNIKSPINDLQEIVQLSFIYSPHGQRVFDHLSSLNGRKTYVSREARRRIQTLKDEKNKIQNQLTNANSILSSILRRKIEKIDTQIEGIQKLQESEENRGITAFQVRDDYLSKVTNATKNLVVEIEDPQGTSELERVLGDVDGMRDALKFMISNYDNLLEKQADFMITLINDDKTVWQNFISNFKSNFFSTSAAGFSISGILRTFLNVSLPNTLAFGSALSLVTNTLITGVSIGVTEALEGIRGRFGSLFAVTAENLKINVLNSFASNIIKDPIIREKLLLKDIIGEDISTRLEELRISNSKSCYNDFDIPSRIRLPENMVITGRDVLLSPDFYLYNDVLTNGQLQEYVDDSLSRTMNIAKIASFRGFLEYDSLIKRIDAIAQAGKIPKRQLDPISNDIGYTGDLSSDLQTAYNAYRNLVIGERDPGDINPDEERAYIQSIEDQFADIKNRDIDTFERIKAEKLDAYRSRYQKVGNIDKRKFNLLLTQRWTLLIEILELYSSIVQYFESGQNVNMNTDLLKEFGAKPSIKNVIRNIKENPSDAKKTYPGYNIDVLKKLTTVVNVILETEEANAGKSVSETKINVWDRLKAKGIEPKNKDGFHIQEFQDEGHIQVEGIKHLQNLFYNKINNFIRINEIYLDSKQNGNAPDFSTIPDMRFLDFYNYRSFEAGAQKINLLQQLSQSMNTKTNSPIKIYPTFKLYFIEEDKNIFFELNTYYSYNAVQSIEISKNKNSSSYAARLILSNLTNTLTDKLSFARESSDFPFARNTENDNLFFGSLDIKPGTMVQIKMGYAADDTNLDTVFAGRIIEMNVGPQTELICQSFGAQLQHEIIQHKFSMLSSDKEHGDIASAALDMIPGLEKMGKQDLFNLGIKDFTGRQLNHYRGKWMHRFALSNLFGSVAGSMFGQDNPRDDNIYLPYQLTDKSGIFYRPTFDWRIYNQTVWEVLQELSLYHRNTYPIIRPYNNDYLSSKKDIRETIVIGDKSGYYKHTDSFSLSSLNYDKVGRAVDEFNELKPILKNKWDINSSQGLIGNPNAVWITSFSSQRILNVKLKNSQVTRLYEFFQERTNSLVIISYILDNLKVENKKPLLEDISRLLNIGQSNDQKLLTSLAEFISYTPLVDPSTHIFYMDNRLDELRYKSFGKILRYMSRSKLSFDITKQEFLNVKGTQFENNDPSLGLDPRYKKIQQHHLISDQSEILSNNITLNNNFANTINLHYLPEPNFVNQGNLNAKQIKNLNMWTIKAFGDIRDEHIRILNTFQKNIDTNWFDIRNSVQKFFSGYSRIYKENGDDKIIKNYIQDIDSRKDKNFDPLKPDWRAFPSFVTVGVSLLQREVEKMYSGTIEIIGNPKIQPMDIVHIEDYLNDMHGTIEVEEVIHTFTPDRGYRTVIVPNLVTYDRDPVQLQDVEMINKIYKFANTNKSWKNWGSLAASAAVVGLGFGLGAGPASLAVTAPTAAMWLWNGTVGAEKQYSRYLYSTMGKILGRDCINFTALQYHSMPYMTGFDGVDYTTLGTLVNHGVEEQTGMLTRLSTWSDPVKFALWTGFDFDSQKYGLLTSSLAHRNLGQVFLPLPKLPGLNTGLTQ